MFNTYTTGKKMNVGVKNMGIPTDEQETVVQFDRSGKTVSIWTSDNTIMTRLDKLYYCTKQDINQGEIVAKSYTAPKKCISFRADPKQNPEYTPKKAANPKALEALQRSRQQKKQANVG
jgi:hypothetical protein